MRSHAVVLSAGFSLGLLALPLYADTFGTGANHFTIDFVNVGNAGNGNDLGAGGGSYSSPYGEVGYNYRISTYEISEDMIEKAAALGMTNVWAGSWTGNQPAAFMTWFEAAAFVNWLNTSQGYQAAYNLTYSDGWSMNLWGASEQASTGVRSETNPYRHKDAHYFLPSGDEWYKAAYHQNDGVTANYWDYPTGGNAVPDGIDFAGDPNYQAVFNDGYDQRQPNAVTDAGSSASAYGTYGQGGNVWEWNESAWDGVNDDASEDRAERGGYWANEGDYYLRSSTGRTSGNPANQYTYIGFRVASVPEHWQPPYLSIRYSQVELCWNSISNMAYNVQYKSILTTNEWTDLFPTNIVATDRSTCVYDGIAPGSPQRFYRVVEAP
jgi:hypothetical protein